jgi:hypothetical protein
MGKTKFPSNRGRIMQDATILNGMYQDLFYEIRRLKEMFLEFDWEKMKPQIERIQDLEFDIEQFKVENGR